MAETDWTCIRTLAHLADLRAADGESWPKLTDVTSQLLPHDQLLASRLTKAGSGRVGSSLTAYVCARVHRRLRALAVASSSKQAVQLEMSATAVLGRMEAIGFGFDRRLCDEWVKEFRERMQSLETEAHSIAGVGFNLDSPSAVANVLFSRLGLAHPGGMSTAKRHYATNRTVLEQLSKSHRLPAVILEWRQLNNALDTALAPLSRLVDDDQRVRGRFDPFTATGRISMHQPNIQSIPKTKFAHADGERQSVRALFKATEGYSLIMIDYSQLELRVLAHMSNDARLLAVLNSRSGDVFDSIARQWKSVLGPVERQKVKQVCYGIIYGMGPTTLAEQMGTDVETARKFTNQFYSDFPGVRKWIDETIELCASRGHIRTLLGRSRRLPHIHSKVAADRSRAERQAINSTIQGSAADIFKCALIDVEKVVAANAGRLVMQIHDEVIVEVPTDRLPTVSPQLTTAMETCRNDLRVKLFVKLKCGKTWDI
uniref:DNA-directed DNA polymerase n=1 Tax=Plectus sambesii TaxID=2011161 RepID=A0A914VNS4_9BILA